jgi:hypothetical protein
VHSVQSIPFTGNSTHNRSVSAFIIYNLHPLIIPNPIEGSSYSTPLEIVLNHPAQ